MTHMATSLGRVALLAAVFALALGLNADRRSGAGLGSVVEAQKAKPGAASDSRAGKPASKAEKSGGKKVLMVIAPKDFRDEELFKPRKLIEAAGYRVVLASTSTQQATGMLGGKAKPDITIGQADVGQYAAVVFIGGAGTTALLHHKGAHELARAADRAGKLVAAICMAPEILANAGLLKGKKATSWRGGHRNLKAKGADVSPRPVVVDGRIITGNGPSAAAAFGQAIVAYLSGK